MMKRFILLLTICLTTCIAKSQSTKASLTASGLAIVSADVENAGSVFFTMGGPGIKLSRDGWHAGIYMLPSLRFKKDATAPDITPILGTGLVMGRKRIVLSIPFYYLTATKEWVTAVGIGVKFGK